MKIKGVIFDLDGTVLDTEIYQFQGWVEILNEFGVEFTEKENVDFVGKSGHAVDSGLIDKYGLNLEKGTLLEKKRTLIKQWLNTRNIEYMPYAKEAIDFFRKEGMKLAIATGATREEATIKLKRRGILPIFDFVSSGSDVEEGKPNPDVYLHALNGLGLEKEDVITFEDTRDGMLSAKAAGLRCFVVPNRFTKNHDFSEADGVFSSLKEAVEFVKEKL